MIDPRHEFEDGTWLEPESMCGPSGKRPRRARAIFPDGVKRVVRCGLPDTFYSVPVKAGEWEEPGYLMIHEKVLTFYGEKSGSYYGKETESHG